MVEVLLCDKCDLHDIDDMFMRNLAMRGIDKARQDIEDGHLLGAENDELGPEEYRDPLLDKAARVCFDSCFWKYVNRPNCFAKEGREIEEQTEIT
jgi:hypothetical protein